MARRSLGGDMLPSSGCRPPAPKMARSWHPALPFPPLGGWRMLLGGRGAEMVPHPPPRGLCWGPVPPRVVCPLCPTALAAPVSHGTPRPPLLSRPAKSFMERRGEHAFPALYPFSASVSCFSSFFFFYFFLTRDRQKKWILKVC